MAIFPPATSGTSGSKCGIFDLTLRKLSHFWMDTILVICDALWNKVQMTKPKCQIKSKTLMSKCFPI